MLAAKDPSTVTHAWLQGQGDWRLDGCQLGRLVLRSLTLLTYKKLGCKLKMEYKTRPLSGVEHLTRVW
jgi:hypothetical protein